MTYRALLAVLLPSSILVTAVACGGSDDGDAFGPAAAGSAGSGGGASGSAGSSTAGSATAGSSTAGAGTAGSGTSGSGTAGSGTAGSGTAGSGTAGSGTAGSGTAGSGTAGGSPACDACVTSMCENEIKGCQAKDGCAKCLNSTPAATCFSRSDYRAVVNCSCGKCANDCPAQDCAAIECLECASTKCKDPFDACVAMPTCAICLSQNPPPPCAQNPGAGALIMCVGKECSATCN